MPWNAPATPIHIVPRDVDFQSRMYGLGVSRSPRDEHAEPCPCLVILTRAADMEASELSLLLAKRGIRVLRVDIDTLTDHRLMIDPLRGVARRDDEEFLKPVLVWVRHFDPTAVPEAGSPYKTQLLRDQHFALLDAFVGSSDVRLINEYAHGMGRIRQLVTAARVGFPVPDTLVTNSLADLDHQTDAATTGGQLIKTLGPHFVEARSGELTPLYPYRLDADDAERGASDRVSVIAQQFIAHTTEIRAYVVGDEVAAFSVRKPDPTIIWTDPDSVSARPVELSDQHEDQLLRLCDALGYSISATDLLATPDNTLAYLETNPEGDWRFFERAADASRQIATMIVDYVEGRIRGCTTPN